VNGSITLGKGAKIGGKLENVNGRLMLQGASVAGGITTVNGDVYLASGSRVDGGIHVEKNSGWHISKKGKNPRITIESGAVVTGPLKFEREVDLYVGAGVQLPAIEGVQPQRFAL
jgi:cytoskeletal protein CcmA (bactofilin family)